MFRSFDTRKVYRNGHAFQIPTSPLCSYRFTVHPDGTGTSWDEDAPDVDQPHGLDYRSHQDIRKAVRIRLQKEHKTPASSSAGGEHLAGGCRVLGIVDSTSDLTTGAGDASIDITDGMFQGRGLIFDQTTQCLWCFTGDGTVSDDPYRLPIHPDAQYDGGDITWTGIHEFDESVDFTAIVNFDGDVSVAGDVNIAGDVTIDGTTVLTGAFLDGTTTFNAVAGENGPTFKIFGDWSARSNNTTYTARTDGIVCAYGNTGTSLLKAYTPSGTLRCWDDPAGIAGGGKSITMPVKGGDTWDVSGADTVYWLPFADNT